MADASSLPDISVSYAIYGNIKVWESWNWYSFDGQAGQRFYFQLSVPAIDPLARFAPDLLLLGPGLPVPSDSSTDDTVPTTEYLANYSIVLPSGYGALKWSCDGAVNASLPYGTPNEDEFEPFGQVVYWARQTADVILADTGTYYIAVGGHRFNILPWEYRAVYLYEDFKYLLAPGYEEEFGVLDFVTIPLDWIKIRMFWTYDYYGMTALVLAAPMAAVVLVGFLYVFALPPRRKELLKGMTVGLRVSAHVGVCGALLLIATALYQLALLLGSGYFNPSSIDSLVLALQLSGVVIGVLSVRQVLVMLGANEWKRLVVPAIFAVIALIVGAGLIVGPLVFLSACVSLVVLNRRIVPA
jgi:hypothetical protein